MRYERDPARIYAQSFDVVRSEARLAELPSDVSEIAVRIIHGCGMPDIASDLAFSDDVVSSARKALAAGAPVLCDCRMVAAGIIQRALPGGNELVVEVHAEETSALASTLGTTRSAAAVERWRPQLGGAIVAIGNAPTALFHLLDRLDAGWPRPAAILAFPVGFVGAAESKAALAEDSRGVPFLTLRGRRGGSPMAAAAINALGLGLKAGAQ